MVVLEEGLHFLRPLWMKLSWQYFHQHPDVLVNVFHGEMLNWRKNTVFFSGQKHSVSNVNEGDRDLLYTTFYYNV